jgi:hypothetical protein
MDYEMVFGDVVEDVFDFVTNGGGEFEVEGDYDRGTVLVGLDDT